MQQAATFLGESVGENRDTSLGGSARRFPSTAWTSLLEPAAHDPEQRRRALENMARNYWKPVYAYIRIKWAKSNDEAKDLTQDFFVWMMETDFVTRADRSRGRFRAFVKVALDRCLSMGVRRERAEKRGGGRPPFTLDLSEGPEVEDSSTRSPEARLDQEWKNALIDRAMGLLGEAYRREDKEVYFLVFRDYYSGASPKCEYKEVAARHGVSEKDVSNYLTHVKKTFRDVVAGLVAETVQNADDLREELAALFGSELS